jgi:hypothetical protein
MFSQSTKEEEEEAHASKSNFRKIKRRQRNLGVCFHSIDQVYLLEL